MSEEEKKSVDVIDLLPDNDRHIQQIENEISTISSKIKKYEMYGEFANNIKKKYNERLFFLLTKVGDLSQPAFDIRDKLERSYIIRYKESPKMGRTLFLGHYSNIHKKYDKLKNGIWKLLELTFIENG